MVRACSEGSLGEGLFVHEDGLLGEELSAVGSAPPSPGHRRSRPLSQARRTCTIGHPQSTLVMGSNWAVSQPFDPYELARKVHGLSPNLMPDWFNKRIIISIYYLFDNQFLARILSIIIIIICRTLFSMLNLSWCDPVKRCMQIQMIDRWFGPIIRVVCPPRPSYLNQEHHQSTLLSYLYYRINQVFDQMPGCQFSLPLR